MSLWKARLDTSRDFEHFKQIYQQMRLSSILSMVRRESVFIESGPYETDGVSVMPAPTGPACPVPQMSSFVRHSD